ncbi:MAG: HAMP domain-containing sensor histidine kinase [Alcanivorax sp.]|nr:HAMP domain-containing sensor histidine kinase [Alcanivorax sp.]
MNLSKLRQTRLFRLSILYSVLIAVGVSIILGGFVLFAQKQLLAQVDAGLIAEGNALYALNHAEGKQALVNTLTERRQAVNANGDDPGARFYALMNQDNEFVINDTPFSLAGDKQPLSEPFTMATPVTLEQSDGDEVRRLRVIVEPLQDNGRLLVGQSLNEIDELRYAMLAALLLSVAAVLISGFIGGALIGRKMVEHLYSVTRATREIMRGNLDKRLQTTPKNDEFDDLSHILNLMLDRIQRLIEDTREANASIAHDLRTPLTHLRSRIETLQQGAQPGSGDDESLGKCLEDIDKLIATFNALLTITGLESAAENISLTPVDLDELAGDIIELYEALAEEKRITLRFESEPGSMIKGNRNLLAQAISNLVDNAIKYSHEGGEIRIGISSHGQRVKLAIQDNGPGIPEHFHDQVFKRFYRMDASRSTPGNGLGLSLVDAVAQAHQARITLRNLAPGLEVTLSFQCLAQPARSSPVR